MDMHERVVLGLDIGSVSIAAVTVGYDGVVRERLYGAHGGNLAAALDRIDAEMDLGAVTGVAMTGRPLPDIRCDVRYEEQVATLESVRSRYPGAGAVLVVGGEKYALSRFGTAGEYEGTKVNSGCAAGTGSFLDQQAGRLGLAGTPELASLALANTAEPPRVATRCAVFAKTDLIHAQQEGYSLAAISDGLCRGLARNLADSLFGSVSIDGPVVFTGGVALNDAVFSQLATLTGHSFIRDSEAPWHGAIGAALLFIREGRAGAPFGGAAALRQVIPLDRATFFPPLELKLSQYPDFSADGHYEVTVSGHGGRPGQVVEVDVYGELPSPCQVWLGIDIGSTSTKAALVDAGNTMVAGFYTRTAGRPVEAFQALLEAIDGLGKKSGSAIDIRGLATTGSGRKFVGGIAGADLVLDEISAHARAAVQLDPDVDTIIEIGGQDSKFTTLSDGRVTSSIMNNVCAAGTGSFVEEQAHKLGVPLADYAGLTDGVRAPRVSDRCTVFMERDMNNLLAAGCTVPEVLAAALHAVRENYLGKVAAGKTIGKKVFFQGATARNRSLVAAFEQKLGRPILVSKFCHLTGAYGAALALLDDRAAAVSTAAAGTDGAVSSESLVAAGTAFRGLDLYNVDIPVRSEVCDLCGNHCKLSVTSVAGQNVAFGFLCGRDYDSAAFVARKSPVPKLSEVRADAERAGLAAASVTGGPGSGTGAGGTVRGTGPQAGKQNLAGLAAATPDSSASNHSPRSAGASRPAVGLPMALTMVEDIGFWKVFFKALDIPVVVDSGRDNKVALGKSRAGAEFCAPMASFFGHAVSLLDRADYVFVPFILEKKETGEEGKRQYCYSTQFAAPLTSQLGDAGCFIMPMVQSGYTSFKVKDELHRALNAKEGLTCSWEEVSAAWERAERYRDARQSRLYDLFEQRPRIDGVEIAILGRPYSVLPAGMNKGIPDMVTDRGLPVWYMDMLEPEPLEASNIVPLIREIPWEYGKTILRVAERVARTPGLYPTLVTSFKCSPDSFVLDAFRSLMDAYGKPYLVLELDEHDSAVGYETRVESAIRSFRNHYQTERRAEGRNPQLVGRQPEAQTVRTGAVSSAASGAGSSARSGGGSESGNAIVPDRFAAVNPRYGTSLKGKKLLVPFWDDLASPLLAATLRSAGVDAMVMEETPETIRASLSTNNGQCLPLNAIAESFMHTVRVHGLDPAGCAVWIARSNWACGIPLYPHQIKSIFDSSAGGFERASVYVGELSFMEISPLAAVDAYQAYLFAGLIRRLGNRIRPYEQVKGMTDAVTKRALEVLLPVFGDRRKSKVQAAEEVVNLFESIPYDRSIRKPLVALFGDFYVRDNPVMNQDVTRYVEDHGGEVVSMPYNQYAKMISDTYFSRWTKERRYADLFKFNALLAASRVLEKAYYRVFGRLLEEPDLEFGDSSESILSRYGVTIEHSGESAENLLKTWYIKKNFPEVSLFVQLSPVFCCAGLVTEAMNRRIEEVTGVPVVSLTYDGTGGGKTDVLAAYLQYPRDTTGRGQICSGGGKPGQRAGSDAGKGTKKAQPAIPERAMDASGALTG